jgi:hypothetical protein
MKEPFSLLKRSLGSHSRTGKDIWVAQMGTTGVNETSVAALQSHCHSLEEMSRDIGRVSVGWSVLGCSHFYILVGFFYQYFVRFF